MTTEAELHKLFESRERSIKRATRRIFKAIPSILEGVNEHLINQGEVGSGDLRWEDVALLNHANESVGKFVMLIGVIELETGVEHMMPSGEIIKITEENKDHFKRLIRVGVPVRFAEQAPADVTKFLQEVARKAAEIQQEQQEMNLSDEDFNSAMDFIEQLEPNSKPQEDFDLEELTKDQKESLLMFSKINEGQDN